MFPAGAGKVENHGNLLSRVFWPIQVAGATKLVEGEDAEGRAVMVQDAKYSLHALRHAAAALWIEQGLSPKRVQAFMGHSSITMTYDTYGYLFDARENDKAAMSHIAAKLMR